MVERHPEDNSEIPHNQANFSARHPEDNSSLPHNQADFGDRHQEDNSDLPHSQANFHEVIHATWGKPEQSTESPPAKPAIQSELRAIPARPGATNTYSVVTSDNEDLRDYELYVPEDYDPAQPHRVIVALHGTTFKSDAKGLMADETGFNQLAEEGNFVVVYPLARSRSVYWGMVDGCAWNTSGINMLAHNPSYDDLKYLDAVLDDVKKQVNVDENAIAGVGFSDGGRVLQEFASTRPGKLATISVVQSTLLSEPPRIQEATSAQIVHSTGSLWNQDLFLPYEGGAGIASKALGIIDGARHSQPARQKEYWSEVNQCGGNPTVKSESGVKTTTFKRIQCNNAEVEEILLPEGQHAWNDIKYGVWENIPLVSTSKNFRVTERVLGFILRNWDENGKATESQDDDNYSDTRIAARQ